MLHYIHIIQITLYTYIFFPFIMFLQLIQVNSYQGLLCMYMYIMVDVHVHNYITQPKYIYKMAANLVIPHADHRWGISRTPVKINNYPACIIKKSYFR